MKFITVVALVAFMAAGAQAGGEAGLGGRSPQGLSQRSAGQLAGPDPGRWGLPTSFGGPWIVGHRAFDARGSTIGRRAAISAARPAPAWRPASLPACSQRLSLL